MKNYHHAEVTTTDQKLDRIIELLESFKVPVVIHVTNPPNPIWPYNPIYPGCGCNHEARELMHPDLGPEITYESDKDDTELTSGELFG